MTAEPTLFPSPAWPLAAVEGDDRRFPIHRIFCVGRNYEEHAKEMGVAVDRQAPFYFLKSALSAVASGATIPYALGTSNFHYETELVVAIGQPAFRVATGDASSRVFGYACGLDMTRRDLQLRARESGRPWDLGKDFEQSAVLGRIRRARDFVVSGQRIQLQLDGKVVQNAKLSDLVWSVPEIIADLSLYYHLQPGDLIFTGTPAGVGPVAPGSHLWGEIEGLPPLELTIGAPE